MSTQQPYRPPASQGYGRSAPAGTTSITYGMVESLRKTRPWVLLMGIVGMIGTGFVFLGALAVFVVGSLPGLGAEAGAGPLAGAALGAIYLLLAILYFIPSLFLLRYAGAIGRIGPQGSSAAFEDALNRQLSFWRFVGILTSVMIVVYVLVIVAVAIAAVVGVSSGV